MILEKILETTQYVVKNSKDVKINEKNIEKLACDLKQEKVPLWNNYYHFKGNPKETIQYLFILDSLNFCFFAKNQNEKWRIKDRGKSISGYFALALGLKKAIKKYPILRAEYLKTITPEILKNALGGKGEIPLLKERSKVLNEVGKILLKKFNGEAENIVKKAKGKAQNLVEIIIKNFPCFRDIAFFKERKIYFLKRAQIFVADLYGAFEGKSLGRFYDIKKLTCFPDYRIPQVLHHFGALNYSPELLEKLKKKEQIRPQSSQEAEIRANTVWAVELLKKQLKKQGRILRSFEIDWILWSKSKKIKISVPHHRTNTIYY